jgi:alkyl sulfatase BDS1-like metallo-beta-lactamase superfamily hydrolase
MQLAVGGAPIELRHARGETDDHLWAWLPGRRVLCSGDFFLWFFPNAGNPQKVQRYPVEWAAALREMAAMGAELLLPAHGLPIAGRERIRRCLDDAAAALEHLVRETFLRMNAGLPLDAILHEVRVPEELLAKPYLRPLYDEPEFVVRNLWRLYGGWWDGNAATLKPPRESELAAEISQLAGGPGRLAARALELAAAGGLRLACSLVELAARAEPASREVHAARAEIYGLRRKQELSLMAKGIYAAAARESQQALGGDGAG